ncbi:MAG: hypothetical protein M3Q40_03285 [Pseudomonadota bacterium]|nr:hypothetical protein [Pseudomonadota bacterium]
MPSSFVRTFIAGLPGARWRRPLAAAVLLGLCLQVSAQDTAPTAAPTAVPGAARAEPIEQQMTPEQFREAGLDRLTPTQLANLNAWLNRTLDTATAKAAATAKSRVVEENRGFLSFGSSEPIKAAVSGEFRGFGSGRTYTLDNGQVWKQVDAATLAGVRKQSPAVTITPSIIGNTWYMALDGYNTRAKVQRIK